MNTKQATCEERVQAHLADRLDDLRLLWKAQTEHRIPCQTCGEDGSVEVEQNAVNADVIGTCPTCEGSGEVETDEDGNVPDLGNLNEYGLSVDYVTRGTFRHQPEGFLRYQLSTGGPGDEFRFFLGADHEPYRVEYWFLDWFDGASRRLHGADRALLLDIFEDWKDCGMVEHWIEEAGEPGEYEDDEDGEAEA